MNCLGVVRDIKLIPVDWDKVLKGWKWPPARRGEFLCPHGVGHDKIPGHVHGCDGCCGSASFDAAWLRYEKKKARETARKTDPKTTPSYGTVQKGV